jgi:uncharacterized protein
MALHPAMSAIAPEMGGLGIEPITGPRLYMFVNSYSVSVGRGAEKADAGYEQTDVEMAAETLAGGYFNEPLHGAFSPRLLERHPELSGLPLEQQQRQLWERFRRLPATADRAALLKLASGADTITFQTQETLQDVFGHLASRRALCLPGLDDAELAAAVRAPVLMISGWYDWSLGDQLATWELLGRAGTERVASRSRLLVTPSAHNMTGYHEGREGHQELDRTYRTAEIGELLARWYTAVREDSLDSWPPVIYYLMGANQWRTAASWPPPEATAVRFYLHAGGTLSTAPAGPSDPDRYRYDPDDPAPTVGGSIVSYVYPPGSVDVSAAQQRPDVLTYTTGPLEHDLDVAGPLTMTLYASSSAVDTDFVARLTDVFPDGRAIQLQAGALRTRYRDPGQEPALLEPGRVYRLDIDMWATACRFRAGHRLRVDIASADFPKFDRNTNRGGDPGPPLTAEQAIYHDPGHPSHLQVLTLPPEPGQD